ncbi:hypothetical protein N431DRAFT_388255, partial [Stipitochalara longipes BDJ]
MDKTYPPSPPFGNLRLATMSDVPRIAVVASASFFYSPLFAWERRYHAQYPEDTLKDYAKQFADFIRNLGSIVVVAKDLYRSNEQTKTQALILSNPDKRAHREGETVVVGVAAWNLPPGSKRISQFVNQDDLSDSAVFDGGLSRDKDLEHSQAIWGIVGKEEKRGVNVSRDEHLLEPIVHPAYWRCGHAKRLMRWGLTLAEFDGAKIGVSTEPSGDAKELYLSLGFVKDEKEPPNQVGALFLEHNFETI